MGLGKTQYYIVAHIDNIDHSDIKIIYYLLFLCSKKADVRLLSRP